MFHFSFYGTDILKSASWKTFGPKLTAIKYFDTLFDDFKYTD